MVALWNAYSGLRHFFCGFDCFFIKHFNDLEWIFSSPKLSQKVSKLLKVVLHVLKIVFATILSHNSVHITFHNSVQIQCYFNRSISPILSWKFRGIWTYIKSMDMDHWKMWIAWVHYVRAGWNLCHTLSKTRQPWPVPSWLCTMAQFSSALKWSISPIVPLCRPIIFQVKGCN